MSSRKRKERTVSPSRTNQGSLFQDLFIQAHEADILRGPSARSAAASLEIVSPPADLRNSPPQIGDGLICWTGTQPDTTQAPAAFPADADVDEAQQPKKNDQNIWIDRYDARLLLDTLPDAHAPEGHPDSPGGWTDLPSDSEDTFFLSPEEVEDYHRDKRRRHLEQAREQRLRARLAEDGEPIVTEDVWGGSDEEPEEAQAELMRRTAAHILSSPNPAQLEMRILANHGADKRFAFLRGRWKGAWNAMKGTIKSGRERQTESIKGVGLGALADYGDSDEESNGEVTTQNAEAVAQGSSRPEVSPDAIKEARRARLKEWTEQRRALRAGKG